MARTSAPAASDLARSLVRELTRLRKHEGLTAARLQACPILMAVLGGGSPTQARERLVVRVEALGEGRPARALRAALAIDHAEHPTLTKRREAVGADLQRYEPSTLIGYEDQAIQQLAAELAAAVGQPAPDPLKADFRLDTLDYRLWLSSGAEVEVLEVHASYLDPVYPRRRIQRAWEYDLHWLFTPAGVAGLQARDRFVYFNRPGDHPDWVRVNLIENSQVTNIHLWVETYRDLDYYNGGRGSVRQQEQQRHGGGPARIVIERPRDGYLYAVRWERPAALTEGERRAPT